MRITEKERLDAPGNYRIVFKLKNESAKSKKRVEQNEGYRSLREASVAVQRLIDSRGYTCANVLGARVIDLDNFPTVVAFVSFSGEVYDREPGTI